MSVYRTEIEVPADRYIYLRLPDRFPVGRASVTVSFPDGVPTVPASETAEPGEADGPEADDIEWWEEFDEPAPPA